MAVAATAHTHTHPPYTIIQIHWNLCSNWNTHSEIEMEWQTEKTRVAMKIKPVLYTMVVSFECTPLKCINSLSLTHSASLSHYWYIGKHRMHFDSSVVDHKCSMLSALKSICVQARKKRSECIYDDNRMPNWPVGGAALVVEPQQTNSPLFGESILNYGWMFK